MIVAKTGEHANTINSLAKGKTDPWKFEIEGQELIANSAWAAHEYKKEKGLYPKENEVNLFGRDEKTLYNILGKSGIPLFDNKDAVPKKDADVLCTRLSKLNPRVIYYTLPI